MITSLGLVLSIHNKNDHDAIIKILTEDKIVYLLAKGFNKLDSKNRSNVFIGSISQFEYFLDYGKNNYYLLKTSELKYLFDFSSHNYFFQEICNIFKFINDPNSVIFNIYLNFVKDFQNNIEKHQFFLTFLISKCLDINGKKLNYQSCVICQTKKNLYCFNIYEGGMLCFDHKMNNQPTSLKLLKSFYYLGSNFNEYFLYTDELDNNLLKNYLNDFLNEY